MMSDNYRDIRKHIISPLLLFLLSLVLNMGVVIALGDADRPSAYEHQVIAENILEGNGFNINLFGDDEDHPTSQQAPGLVSLYTISRRFTPKVTANLLLMVFEAFVMAFASVFIYFGLQFWGVPRLTSFISGLLVVIHPNYLYAPTHIQVVSFSIFFVTLGFMTGSYLLNKPSDSSGIAYAAFGFICGIGMLFEPILVMLPIIFFVGAFLLKRKHLRSILKKLVIWFLPVWIIILAPWTMRNLQVHGRAMMIKSTFWYSFWQGNNPESFGTDKIPPEGGYGYFDFITNQSILDARGEVTDINSTLSPQFIERISDLPETDQFDAFKVLALSFLRDDPFDYLRLVLKRIGYFVWIDTTNPKSFHPLYWGTTILLWLGLLLGFKHLYRENRRLLVWLFLFLGFFGLFHVLTIYAARFRMPIEWVFLVFWGFFLVSVIERWKGKHRIAIS